MVLLFLLTGLTIYIFLLYALVLRFQSGWLKKELQNNSKIIMWVVEFTFTVILPFIGFLMIHNSNITGDEGSLSDINSSSLIKISETLFPYFALLVCFTSLIYLSLRIYSEKSNHLLLINSLLIVPFLVCLFTCIWLGKSLIFGLFPLVITLPVISPVISLLYIILLFFQNSRKLEEAKAIQENILTPLN